VPIILGPRILGLIHVADRREDMVPLATVEMLERVAMQLGTALQRVTAEEGLRRALAEAEQRQEEITALQEATRAVLESGDFQKSVRIIYDKCKALTKSTAGYVSLLAEGGDRHEPLFLDPGDTVCTVDPALPMPLRGLRAESYRTGEPVYDNDFPHSDYAGLLPEGHSPLENVLFAPMVVRGQTLGLIALANKPGGFTEHDAGLAAGFGELAAIALVNHKAEEEQARLIREVETERARFEAVLQQMPAGVAIIAAPSGDLILANRQVEEIFRQPIASVSRLKQLAEYKVLGLCT
jgi:GAF domain-containing protein